MNLKSYTGNIMSDKYILRFGKTSYFMYQSGPIYNIKKDIINPIKNFNLNIMLENTLSKIYNFNMILDKIESPILYSLYIKNDIIELEGNDMQENYYGITNLIDDNYNKLDYDEITFWFSFSKYYNPKLKDNELEKEWKIPYSEFYTLIQIHFGLYQETEYKKELEQNEKNGKYDKISTSPNYNDEITPELVQEYLKLQLMKKDTSGAFEGLKLEKIYDKNWSKKKQREKIDEINKEFGEEVIVE